MHLLILCTMLIISACGGGGGSSPTSPSLSISFSGTSSPGNDAVYMAKNDSLSSGDVIAIDVKLNNVSGSVFGAAFDVNFDSAKIDYTGYSPGDFLEQGGNTVTYLPSEGANKAIFGISRLAPASGVSGSGTIITLKFKAVAAGDSMISFSGNSLKDSSGNTVTVNNWYGGTVTVE